MLIRNDRTEQDGDWYFYPQFLAHENPKNAHKSSRKNYKTGMNFPKICFSPCLLVVLGLQGFVVKCTVAIFFGTVDNFVKVSTHP